MKEIRELRTAKIWIDEYDIVCVDLKLKGGIAIADAKDITAATNELAKLVPLEQKKFLFSIDKFLKMPKEVQKYFANYPTEYDWKIALVHKSIGVRILSTWMMNIQEPRFKTRSFSDYEAAVHWLRFDV